MRLRASRVAAALIAALCSLPAFAFGARTCEKPRLKTDGSKVKLEIEHVAASQSAAFTGVVRDATATITVGMIAEPLMMNDGTGVRLSHDFMNKMPF